MDPSRHLKEKPISPNQEEQETIRKVQSGDKDEFRHLVACYQNLVLAMILRQVGIRAVAQDLAQEVFVRAYFSINKFRSDSSFSTWITRIALNQTSSYFSSKKYKTQKLTESFDTKRHDIGDQEVNMNNEQKEQQNILIKNFHVALASIPPIFRDALALCALEEKSYQEAAQILEIPIGTVRSRLNKARLLLAAAIRTKEA